MNSQNIFNKIVYRIKHIGGSYYDLENYKGYEHNNSIGIFEFLTEKNARKYIKEQKLKNVVVDEVVVNITENVKTL